MSNSKRIKALEERAKQISESQNVCNKSDIVDHIADVYKPLHDDIQNYKHQYYNLPGGRGSCKSSFISLEIVDGIMKDADANAIVFRKFASTLRDSVFSQIAWAIDTLGASHLWKSNVSPMQYVYIPTGQKIIFRGLDKSEKLKSIKLKKGYFKFLWFEEFAELDGQNSVRSVQQSVIRGSTKPIIFRSFNPPMSRTNWANAFVAAPDEKTLTFRTTYLDIPADWLGESFIYEAEHLKETNEKAYKHEYLGEATGTGGAVFPNIIEREITESEINNFDYIYAGLDFGFSTDPVVFMRLAYDRKTETIYLLNEIYKKHLSNKQTAEAIKEKGFDKTGKIKQCQFFESTLQAEQKQTIICDCAEPKSIADLRNEGLSAFPCKKYSGSVMYGIKWLQHKHIVIDAKRTPEAHREFTLYEYMQTKDGEFLTDVPDKNNHTIDAVRYGLDRLINSSKNPA